VPQPTERIAPPKVDREIAPAVEPPPRELPMPPAPQSVAPVTPPKVQREIAPAVEPPPRAVPAPPAPPVSAPVERIAPPAEVPPPRSTPADTRAPPERVAPKVEREIPPPAAPLPKSGPMDSATRVERVAPPTAAPGKAPAATAPARTETQPGESPPRLRFGAPDAGDEIFKPRGDVTPPAAEPGGPPRLDLDATRQRAREITSEGAGYRGLVPVIPPPPPERKSKLAQAIEKAEKPDCRDAYAGMGLLAVVPLVASTVGNGGCRW
jgi:hypothetical protein